MCQGRQEKQAQTGTARKDRHGPPHGGLLGQSEHGDPDSASSLIAKATRTCLQGVSLYAPLGDLMITRRGRPRGFKNPTPDHGPGPVAHVADDCGMLAPGPRPSAHCECKVLPARGRVHLLLYWLPFRCKGPRLCKAKNLSPLASV